MDIQKKDFQKRWVVGRTKPIKMSEMKDNPHFMETYSAVGKYAQESGQQITSAVAIYKSWDMEKGESEVMPGFFVDEGFNPGEFELFEVPAGTALVGVHEGDYMNLGKSHETMMAAAKEEGTYPKLVLEEYLNMPGPDTPVEDLRTNIYQYL